MTELEKVKQLIINSGNNFHCKVLNYLKGKEWSVLISPYYNDNISEKPREIDLIAEKAFKINDEFGNYKGHINIKLFIECKHISQDVVFWFHHKDMNEARELVLRTTPVESRDFYTEKHHYLSGDKRVAKLFASDSRKTVENDPFYKALNQSLNAMVYYRDGDSIIPPPPKGYRNILWTLNYPIIICNSFNTFYKVDIEKTDAPENIKDNFQLEVNYAYMDVNKNHRNEYFLIDVVNYEEADKFLEILEQDIDAIRMIIQ